MTTSYLGLTWDHPRGRNALEAAARQAQAGGLSISWDTHSLEGFESAPIKALAERYDLIVLDHPHLGDAIEAGCLQPMEQVIGAETLRSIASRAVGASLDSYRAAGSTWALPLDAATQVSVRRADLLDVPPADWAEVVARASQSPVALSLAGPHAYLTFASACQAFGSAPARSMAASIVDAGTGIRVLEMLREIAATAPAGSERQNPIQLLERMRATDDIAYIPLVYGYVGYSARDAVRPLDVSDAPRGPSGEYGSTLGGTGIAVTSRAVVTDELVEHLRWLLDDEVQSGFIPAHDGQPSVRCAWESEDLDAQFRGFYRSTRNTIERAWVRPRFPGFTRLQQVLSALVRDALQGVTTAEETVAMMTAAQNEAIRSVHDGVGRWQEERG